jgi:hypothetical protein
VIVAFDDHRGFQRAALTVAGVGGAAALGVALLQFSPALPVVTGAMAITALVFVARGQGWRRLAAIPALALFMAMAVQASLALDLDGALAVLGAPAAGLVAALGLLPLHLRLDPVGAALRGAALEADARGLCLRASAAEAQIRQALVADRVPDARALRRQARTVALATVDTARKARLLTDTAASVDGADLAARIEAHPAAAPALREQQAHLMAISAAAERLNAHLHGQVALLEATVLALAARRGALAADQAAALGPLVDRLREVGSLSGLEATVLLAGIS